jgi:Uma2 family endonuclease
MAVRTPLFTYDDLARMPNDGKRYELNDGELVVSPAPTTDHQSASVRLSSFLFRAEEAGYGRVFVAPTDVVFGRHRATQPDLLFIRRDRLHIVTAANIQGAPDLIVEILSPGTREDDLGWKMTLYAHEGVTLYWVVDAKARAVQPHRLREGGYVAEPLLSTGDTLGCPLFPGITSDVARLFP